jgi:hypothetical protein
MTNGENSETAELRQQLAELLALNQILREQHAATTQRVDTLNQFVLRVAGASSVENVLVKGFETLSAQLEPLRDLTPKRTPMDDDGYARLQNLRDTLARPNWSNASSLSVLELPVAFIGEVVRPQLSSDGTAEGSATS